MLDSLDIGNFRSCEQVHLKLGEPVIALLGKNGVGKTNVLHAIQAVADICVGESDPIFALTHRDFSQPTEFVLRFTLKSARYDYNMSRLAPLRGRSELYEESLTRDGNLLFDRRGERLAVPAAPVHNELSIATSAASLPSLLQILPSDAALREELSSVSKYLRSIQYHPLLQQVPEHLPRPWTGTERGFNAHPYVPASSYETWKTMYHQGRQSRSVQMRLIHLHLENKDGLAELRQLLGQDGLGLLDDIQLQDFKRGKLPSDKTDDDIYYLSFTPGRNLAGSDRTFSYNGLSAGTWRVLQMLTYLVFDQNTCMLLEQPEDSIHHGLLAKVIDILKTYADRTQLICTTHSSRVKNLVGPNAIRIVKAENSITSVTGLTGQEIECANQYIDDEGTLDEFLETL